MTSRATHRAIDAVWRIEAARLIAGLARIVRDIGLAEDLAQDALVAALEQWPESGVPRNPGAWLMAIAKRRAIDLMRRNERLGSKIDELGHELETGRQDAAPDATAALDDDIGDERAARLSSVLEVVYLIFNEGYSATAGDDWMRPALCEEALRLGRILAELAPGEPEVHGLVALMEIQASRSRARVGPSGEPLLLLDQDRGRWDWLLIGRGLAALERAERLGGEPGPYVLQAAIAACHARARAAAETDWARIAALYGELVRLTPSPVVELNRAMAVAMAEGPLAGLAIADALLPEPSLRG